MGRRMGTGACSTKKREPGVHAVEVLATEKRIEQTSLLLELVPDCFCGLIRKGRLKRATFCMHRFRFR